VRQNELAKQQVKKLETQLRSEEEWQQLSDSVAENKAALKLAREDVSRKATLLSAAKDENSALEAELSKASSAAEAAIDYLSGSRE